MVREARKKEFILAAMFVSLTACSHGNDSASGRGVSTGLGVSDSGRHTLTYYLDMQSVAAGDRAIQLLQYQAIIRNCKSMQAPIVPLSPSDVAKLTLRRTQIWQEPGRSAKQSDYWEAKTVPAKSLSAGALQGMLCHFTGVKKISKLDISMDSGKVYSINLTKGTGTVQTGSPSVAPGRMAVAADDQVAAERRDVAAGFVKGVMSSVAGQSCRMWSYPGGAAEPYDDCVWSEGQKWGYPATNQGGLVLSSKLADGSYEKAVTFLVGRLPDGGKVFDVPDDVSIRNETPRSVVQ